jgi:hypothetical protein
MQSSIDWPLAVPHMCQERQHPMTIVHVFEAHGSLPQLAAFYCQPYQFGVLCAKARDNCDRLLCSGHGRAWRMVYALFMILVLLTLGAMWRGHVLQLPLFLLTVALVLLHVLSDMTTPLTLSF